MSNEHAALGGMLEHLIAAYGFPGPGAHRWMYANLREKPL